MRHGDLIGIGTPKKLGLLLLGPYSRFIYILELEYILEVEQIKVCTFICCEYTFSCTRKKRTVTLSSDSSEEENEEDEEVITNNIMGKNTKKISAGIKNPNNKSQAKAARSFLRNRWWIEYKNVLIAILVLSISVFAATIFVNVKNLECQNHLGHTVYMLA